MTPEYRRDMEHNYMVLAAPDEVSGNEYQVRMLFVNQIIGFLRCKMHVIDGRTEFYYEITSKQPVSRVFQSRKIGCEDIRTLFLGIEKALDQASAYLLNSSNFILDPEYIYMDVETKEVSLCYLPFYEKEITETFRGLAEYILQHLEHEDEQAVLWGYTVYSKTSEENYSVKEVLQSVYKQMAQVPVKEAKKVPQIKVTAKVSEPEIPKEAGVVRKKVKNTIKPDKRRQRSYPWKKTLAVAAAGILLTMIVVSLLLFGVLDLTQTGGLLFLTVGIFVYLFSGKRQVKKKAVKAVRRPVQPEEEIFDEYITEEDAEQVKEPEREYGATTVLSESSHGIYPVLISIHPELRENIIMTKEEILIGKLKGQVDAIVKLPTISRFHAKLERRDTGCVLTDLNSTNGTFVNGERLQANESKEIRTGDEIFFAGAGYYFKS